MRWSLNHLARACTAVLLIAVPLTSALHESDVGVVDWHKLLVGVPLIGAASTAPSFHLLTLNQSVDNNDAGGKVEVIYTATGNNVLTALNPKDGSVVWRHVFEPNDRIGGYYPHSNFVATLSGSNLRVFDGVTGAIRLEKRIYTSEAGQPTQPNSLGTHIAFGTADDELFVLTDGHIVRSLNITTGAVQWSWVAEDQGAMTVNTHILTTPTAIYVIGLTKSTASLTLHINALDPETGKLISSRDVPSKIQRLDAYSILSDNVVATVSKAPHVAWLENGVLKTFKLTPSLHKTKPAPITLRLKAQPMVGYERLVDVGLSKIGHILAVAGDGSATLLGLGDDQVEGVGAFPPTINPIRTKGEDGKEADDENTESVWVGGLGTNKGEVVFGRVYWSHAINKAKTDTLKYIASDAPFPLLDSANYEVTFDTRSHGIIGHAISSHFSSDKLLLTTTTGALQLWDLSATPQERWTREEALASIILAEFVELPEGRVDASSGGARKDGESFGERVWRHTIDTKNLPQYVAGFIRRFLTGSYASTTSSPVSSSPSEDTVTRDAFGFRQLIVTATAHGKLFAIDSSNGRIVWSRVLGLGWAAEVGASVMPVKMFIFGAEDTAGDREGRPEVVIVAQRRAENTLVDTVIFHIDALTGADASKTNPNVPDMQEDSNGLLQGFDIVPGPVVEAFLLSPPDSSSSGDYAKAVLLLDEFLQVYLYPSTPQTRATLIDLQPSLHFPLRTNTPDGTRIVGHAIGPHHAGAKVAESDEGERGFVAHATWTLGLPPNEVVKKMVPSIRGPVASIGKVLGNRTTLYKYLNPRLFVLLTSPPPSPSITNGDVKSEDQTCGLYVVDAVKGTVVYKTGLPATLETGNEPCNVKATLVENWLVYHYYDPEWTGPGLTKGWKIGSVELYEGALDEKTMSSDMSSYSSGSAGVLVFEQAYVFPHAITALSPTTTKFGMTVKDLIVASRAHQVQSIPRRLLNPRRPKRKVTAEEQEEFLVPYEPVLAYDPQRVLSHSYEVANVNRIVTSPSLLESTSLVFAYGLDMFLTRVAPSNTFDVLNENFNKVQLVLTVSGLALAIIFTKPMVRRKLLREKWYQ